MNLDKDEPSAFPLLRDASTQAQVSDSTPAWPLLELPAPVQLTSLEKQEPSPSSFRPTEVRSSGGLKMSVIELMTIVIIIGVLAAIGAVTYSQFVQSERRSLPNSTTVYNTEILTGQLTSISADAGRLSKQQGKAPFLMAAEVAPLHPQVSITALAPNTWLVALNLNDPQAPATCVEFPSRRPGSVAMTGGYQVKPVSMMACEPSDQVGANPTTPLTGDDSYLGG